MNDDLTVDIIIPSYKPDKNFYEIIRRLEKQTKKARNIIIINTCEEYFDESRIDKKSTDTNIKIIHITKAEFNHGGTRNYAASLSDADLIMLMTQDALPANKYLIEKLIEPFDNNKIGVSYAKQTSKNDAGVIEKYTRKFNYPNEDFIKSKNDLERLGIKTYFCSNACAMYRNSVYKELGGFVTDTIFNEDMIMASKIIKADYLIAYASHAEVIHSHKYSYIQQFKRNFDLAVSQQQYKEIFNGVKSESEGIRLVKKSIKYLIEIKKIYLVPDLILQSGFKFLGYKFGKAYEKMPLWLIRKCSMNQEYWIHGKK